MPFPRKLNNLDLSEQIRLLIIGVSMEYKARSEWRTAYVSPMLVDQPFSKW